MDHFLEERFVRVGLFCHYVHVLYWRSIIMSARRKHVRAHARDVEVEVDLENGDRVCRVEEIKGGNVIEVSKQTHQKSFVVVGSGV